MCPGSCLAGCWVGLESLEDGAKKGSTDAQAAFWMVLGLALLGPHGESEQSSVMTHKGHRSPRPPTLMAEKQGISRAS